MTSLRYDWTKDEIQEIYRTPLMDLIFSAASVHRRHHDPGEVQVCTLLSVKTGGCPEDCAYCPQSARYDTGVDAEKMLDAGVVISKARVAKETGSTRFCMGAAWRDARKNEEFDRVVGLVKDITDMGLEVCCTLGMLTDDQAAKLKEAGLYAYNHNLDTGEEYYKQIITTRSYDERLNTLKTVRNHNISVCCGGIIGMGESESDRIDLIHTLSTLPEHPESVPVNALVPVKGTPMENMKRVSVWEMIRMIATIRITMPKSIVRLSAGRVEMPESEQALCFMAGANSIFAGDKLLVTPNNDFDEDIQLLDKLGMKPRKAFKGAKPEHLPT